MTRDQKQGVICFLSGGQGRRCRPMLGPACPSCVPLPSAFSQNLTVYQPFSQHGSLGGKRLLWGMPREETASSQGCSCHQDQACWHPGQLAHSHPQLSFRSPKPAVGPVLGTLVMWDRAVGNRVEKDCCTVGARDLRTWQVFPKNGEGHLHV